MAHDVVDRLLSATPNRAIERRVTMNGGPAGCGPVDRRNRRGTPAPPAGASPARRPVCGACSSGLRAEGRIEPDVAIAAHQVVIDNCGCLGTSSVQCAHDSVGIDLASRGYGRVGWCFGPRRQRAPNENSAMLRRGAGSYGSVWTMTARGVPWKLRQLNRLGAGGRVPRRTSTPHRARSRLLLAER